MMRWIGAAAGAVVLGIVGMQAVQGQQQPYALRVRAPELKGVTEWVNTKPLTMEKLRGHVVVLHFWTFG